MCKILANMTQVSDVAPGPLVFCLLGLFTVFAKLENFCQSFCPASVTVNFVGHFQYLSVTKKT
jgi:hypothetical protein